MPFSSPLSLLITIAFQIDGFRRHEYVYVDEVASPTRQRHEEWMRPLGRRDVQDGERNPSRQLYECGPPLYVEGEAREVGNRVPIAAHCDAGGNVDVGSLSVMTWR